MKRLRNHYKTGKCWVNMNVYWTIRSEERRCRYHQELYETETNISESEWRRVIMIYELDKWDYKVNLRRKGQNWWIRLTFMKIMMRSEEYIRNSIETFLWDSQRKRKSDRSWFRVLLLFSRHWIFYKVYNCSNYR